MSDPGPSLKEIEGNLLYIDEGGNLVLDTIGKTNGQIQSGDTPQFLVKGGPTPSAGRIRLTADTQYEVATTGSNTTGDGSIAKPWATPQYASDWIFDNLDFRGFNVTVKISDGAYPGFDVSAAVGCHVDALAAKKNISFIGNEAAPENVIIDNSLENYSISGTGWNLVCYLSGVTIRGSGTIGVWATWGSFIQIGKVIFGPMSSGFATLMVGYQYGYAAAFGDVTVIGNVNTIVSGTFYGAGDFEPSNLTFSGGTTLGGSCAYASVFGLAIASLGSVTGSCTGPRVSADTNSAVYTYGSGVAAIPGDSFGSCDASSSVDGIPGTHGTATASASAATLNATNGVITSQALSSTTTFTLTLTNSFITANSVIIINATNSDGAVTNLLSVTPGAGSVVIATSFASLTGTVKIAFQVLN